MSSDSDTADVLEQLRALPTFAGLQDGLEALAALGRIEAFDDGAMLFELGQPAEELRWVIDGRVALFLSDPRGESHTIGTASAGDLLGWSALRDRGATWTVSARAARPSKCLAFDGRAVRDLCDREPVFGHGLIRAAFEVVAQRLTDARLQMLDVYGEN